MQVQLKEQQIYEDLSMILQLIKKKLVLFINNSSPHQQKQSNQENQAKQLLDAFTLKYTHHQINNQQIHKVIQRFFCRLKELINQLLTKIPKSKIHLIHTFKNLEEFTVKHQTQYNNLALVRFIQLVLAIRQFQYSKSRLEIKSTHLKDRFPFLKDQNDSFVGNKAVKRQLSQVEIIQKNALLYNSIDIDFQHFRGKYFDLKNNQGSYIQNQMLFRNRYIKQIITAFENQYERYKTKEFSTAGTKMYCNFRKSDDSVLAKSFYSQREKIETTNSLSLGKSTKIGRQGLMVSRRKKDNLNYNTIDNTMNKMTIQTFRSLFEQKINQKTNNIKVKNVIINLNGSQKIKGQFFNSKRLQFFKKSQDQVRLRYKYYNYKSTNNSKSSIKYRTINPQSAFNTIDN